jgi:signal transduction histidine kinase
MNNVEKHSGASYMVLTLQKIQNSLFLSISDDGRGEVRLKPESHGLQNIMHRAKLIRGKVEWKAPEKFETGTMFVLSLPLESVSEEKEKA